MHNHTAILEGLLRSAFLPQFYEVLCIVSKIIQFIEIIEIVQMGHMRYDIAGESAPFYTLLHRFGRS